jgi:hypothetical protein
VRSSTKFAYSWFIAIAAEAIGVEAARLFAGEVLRATRDGERAA